MGKYLHLFETEQEFNAQYEGSGYTEPWVSYTMETSAVTFNKEPHDYSKDYLTFDIISDGTIVWKANNTAYTTSIEYSIDDGGTWNTITSNTGASAPSINVSAGDKVLFKGENATYSSGSSRYNFFSDSTATFNVYGNIMSLIYGDNFIQQTTLSSTYTFCSLFRTTNIVDASNLILPATTIELSCYRSMFQGCTGLTSAPELPATTIAQSCYQSMFNGCTSLTTAPELPATTLVSYCYQAMFNACTSLNYIKCLATDINAYNCTSSWVHNVAAAGTFVKNASMSGWGTGSDGIPSGWNVQNATS